MNPYLVLPSEKYKESFLEALTEQDPGQMSPLEGESYKRFNGDFEAFLAYLSDECEGKNLLAGRVPQTVFWIIDGEKFIGRISVRHRLNDVLMHIGGHVGYSIRPSERHKGYGSIALGLVLPKVRELGIEKALLTCLKTNEASRRIIEKNGGVFENEVTNDEGLVSLRFWVPTK